MTPANETLPAATSPLRAGLVQAARVFASCVVIVAVLLLLGRGPWTRWVPPTVLITIACGMVGAWRAMRDARATRRPTRT